MNSNPILFLILLTQLAHAGAYIYKAYIYKKPAPPAEPKPEEEPQPRKRRN